MVTIDLDILLWRWRVLSVLGQGLCVRGGDFRLERVPGGWRGFMTNEQSEEFQLGMVDREVVLSGWLKDLETTSEAEEKLRSSMLKKLSASHRRALRVISEGSNPQWTFCVWGTLNSLDAVCVGSKKTGRSAYANIWKESERMRLLQCPTSDVVSWATEYMELTPSQVVVAEKLLMGLPITAKDRRGAVTAKQFEVMRAGAEKVGLPLRD